MKTRQTYIVEYTRRGSMDLEYTLELANQVDWIELENAKGTLKCPNRRAEVSATITEAVVKQGTGQYNVRLNFTANGPVIGVQSDQLAATVQ